MSALETGGLDSFGVITEPDPRIQPCHDESLAAAAVQLSLLIRESQIVLQADAS